LVFGDALADGLGEGLDSACAFFGFSWFSGLKINRLVLKRGSL
jgi:hypothetical protein